MVQVSKLQQSNHLKRLFKVIIILKRLKINIIIKK